MRFGWRTPLGKVHTMPRVRAGALRSAAHADNPALGTQVKNLSEVTAKGSTREVFYGQIKHLGDSSAFQRSVFDRCNDALVKLGGRGLFVSAGSYALYKYVENFQMVHGGCYIVSNRPGSEPCKLKSRRCGQQITSREEKHEEAQICYCKPDPITEALANSVNCTRQDDCAGCDTQTLRRLLLTTSETLRETYSHCELKCIQPSASDAIAQLVKETEKTASRIAKKAIAPTIWTMITATVCAVIAIVMLICARFIYKVYQQIILE
jgi:hypothetical protein